MAAKPFKHRPALSGLPKDAERDLIDQFKAIENDLAELRARDASVSAAATPVLAVASVAAKVGELLLLAPPAGGTLVTLPQGSPENITKRITLAVVGGHLSPGAVVSIVGRKGTINGQQTLTLNSIRLVELVSIGDGGWVFDCCVEAAYPIGSIYISTNSANPATTLGFGTWAAFGAGRVPVGFDSGQTEFDTDEETGGAKTVAAAGTNSAPNFTGTTNQNTSAVSAGTPSGTNTGAAVADHPSHTHTYTQVPNHVHVQRGVSNNTAGTAGVQGGSAANTTNLGDTANPTGGVATATTNGPNATLTHNVTQPTFTGNALGTHQHTLTPAGTVSAPTFTGTPTSVLQPYIVVRMWKRTA